jgi:hypothetical protein
MLQVGSSYSWAQTNNSTEGQVQSVPVSNMTYIIVFANKTIVNIDNQTSFVSSVVGNNLERVQEAIAMTLNISSSEQLREEAGEILRGGISGSNCKNLAEGDNKKVECVKSGDKIFYYVSEIVPSKEVTNLTKGFESSIANVTLGYKSLYERTTSPKIFTPEQQAMIDNTCESLKNNYSSLSVTDRNWYLANC